MHAMTDEIGKTMRLQYHDLCANCLVIKIYKAIMMLIWANSTPKLKEIKDNKKLFWSIPVSFNALAKPNPWINPNINTISKLYFMLGVFTIFWSAVIKIENAIKGSTIALWVATKPAALNPSVMLCATVNVAHCITIDLSVLLKK